MSLFDVIKYPLSNPPTTRQLMSLPPYVFNAAFPDLALSRNREFIAHYRLEKMWEGDLIPRIRNPHNVKCYAETMSIMRTALLESDDESI